MFRLWIILFLLFASYTIAVYRNCDEKDVTATNPDVHALAGWKVWQRNNCQSCHQIYGLGGYMGPDLTNVVSDSGKRKQYLQTFIKYGTGKMPDFHLSDSEVNNLIAFLHWIDKSGRSKVPIERVTSTWNYNFSK
jgi:nitric oxide reductase subunit C